MSFSSVLLFLTSHVLTNVEVTAALCALKALRPDRVHLHRGNHEVT